MNDERRRQIEALFEAALGRTTAEREAYLESACAGDAELLAEVQALLAAHQLAEEIFSAGADDSVPQARDIGPYRILREIGRGGMGVVYLADRADGQYRRRVAVKLIDSSDRGDPLHQRFLVERQILAGLEHPNIARLLDGGITDDGRPYLVLEYVDGLPITVYCDRHRLPIAERLRLFLEVCAAVQHAHQNLVIHRDLKPSNILVTAAGEVRLLDFGIAKLLNPTLSAASTLVTHVDARVMTPEYASPEQVRGDSITTASDVYSLGVLLYELLAGSRPYQLATGSPAEVISAICERDPERPSARVRRTEPGATGSERRTEITLQSRAAARSTTVERLQRRLRGDLDSIVLMAMRKEPGRRYGSVELLKQDIARHLQGLPVSAHAGNARYRLQKFVRRHRVESLSAVLVVVSLLVGAGIASRQAVVTARERDRAELERAKAEAVAGFLEGVFTSADPFAPSGERLDTLRIRDVLKRGADRARNELADQPLVQAQVLDAVGRVYRNLGLHHEARVLLEQALATRRSLHGDLHPDVAESLTHLAILLIATGEMEHAQRLLEEALATNRAVWGTEHPSVAVDLHHLATVHRERGRYDEAERHHLEAIAMLRRTSGETDPRLPKFLTELVGTLEWEGDYAAARRYAEESVALHRRLFGSTHPELAVALREAGLLLQRTGDYAPAEALFRQAYEIATASLGEEHPQVADLLNRLASVRAWQKDLDSADSLHRRSLALKRRLYGDLHIEVAYGLNNLASTLREKGELRAADSLHLEALDIARRLLGEEHSAYWILLSNRGMTRSAMGECGAAEPMLRASSEGMRRTIPREPYRVALNQSWLGGCLIQLGRYAEAEQVLVESYQALRPRGSGDRLVRQAAGHLATLYTRTGRPARALEYRAVAEGHATHPSPPAP